MLFSLCNIILVWKGKDIFLFLLFFLFLSLPPPVILSFLSSFISLTPVENINGLQTEGEQYFFDKSFQEAEERGGRTGDHAFCDGIS
jgi:hypothetical protein